MTRYDAFGTLDGWRRSGVHISVTKNDETVWKGIIVEVSDPSSTSPLRDTVTLLLDGGEKRENLLLNSASFQLSEGPDGTSILAKPADGSSLLFHCPAPKDLHASTSPDRPPFNNPPPNKEKGRKLND